MPGMMDAEMDVDGAWTVRSDSAEETLRLGRALGRAALAAAAAGQGEVGWVIALRGDLGAGKTCFTQGVGEVIVPDADVTSPTFILIAEHDGPLIPLLHADLYRIDSAAALAGIGLEEVAESWPGLALIEWADRFPDVLPTDHLFVQIRFPEEDNTAAARLIQISATGPAAAAALARWQAEAAADG